ncbi:MAG TPA: hypothetical protein ENH62_05880 [Marinobacter sp.]|uniref:Uncharacterized protein n=1 Tax=marine sediment metagenome TaxID=412755 RepID=A0A0F9WD32_9ZZZZ|nr:hypothetical protein [Marinobacter sp.]
MKDQMMFGIVIFGFVAWVLVYAHEIWSEWRRKKFINQQIDDGVVPQNYSKVVKEWATRYDAEAMSPGMTDEQDRRHGRLSHLRQTVGMIRARGFDEARRARQWGMSFNEAIADCPYEKGSGEAQQWTRGFCQESGVRPKEWMERA